MKTIFAETLRKSYGTTRAVDEISLEVTGGTIFALLGPNGAGKSTTIRILTTLTRPDGGSASVAGHDVLREPSQVRRSIGVVGQRHGLDPDATGRENLELQGSLYGLHEQAAADARRRAPAAARPAGRAARTYSGGMQRRLDIALGLLHRPSVLFLDEPTTGLDPESRTALWAEIRRFADEDGMTVLLTTHYLDEADRLASRLAIVDHGRVVAEGSPDRLKSELEGDAIHVELADAAPPEAARDALARIDGLRDVSVDGRTVRGRTRDGGRAVPVVIEALASAGLRVATASVARPSLDDVYLRHTGRTFAVAA
jgi:ABC-2 type transport system ATP-binding protein